MDDSCAVCADTLEWVAYGSCGHRDVCSTCVARLRFICGDRRCCICKSESAVVFVTKVRVQLSLFCDPIQSLEIFNCGILAFVFLSYAIWFFPKCSAALVVFEFFMVPRFI